MKPALAAAGERKRPATTSSGRLSTSLREITMTDLPLHGAALRMRMKFRFTVVIILAIVAFLVAQNSTPLATTPKRAITEKDLFDFIWVANPQLSPDGSRVAFTRVSVDEKRTGYETSIWTVATSGSEPPVRAGEVASNAGPLQRANCGGHCEPVLRIMIEYQELGSSIVREGLA